MVNYPFSNKTDFSSIYFEKSRQLQRLFSNFMAIISGVLIALLPILLSIITISQINGVKKQINGDDTYNFVSEINFSLDAFNDTRVLLALLVIGFIISIIVIILSLYMREKYQEYIAKYMKSSIAKYCEENPFVISSDNNVLEQWNNYYLRLENQCQFGEKDILEGLSLVYMDNDNLHFTDFLNTKGYKRKFES